MWPSLAQGYLIFLLAAMAVGQAASPGAFRAAVAGYGIRRPGAAALGLLGGETAAALLLLIEPTRLAGGVLALVVASVWTVLAVRGLAQKRRVPNCGCFGGYARQPLRWWVIPQDVMFVALAVWAILVELD